MSSDKISVPVIDISPFLENPISSPQAIDVARKIYDACSTWGFFQITGHGVPTDLQEDLLKCSKDFFAQPEEQKLALHVKNGGVAWRGYMPLGGEGTHGRVDHKEGMYFGPEHSNDHRHAGLPLHGKNQFPDIAVPAMRATVLQYINQLTELGKTLADLISLSLGLDGNFIRDNYLAPEPIALFRSWRYALDTTRQAEKADGEAWGIGQHTDFGLLTILSQESSGLQVFSPQQEWVDIPVIQNAFVCNVGDMLDMITGGRFKSVPHRVLPLAPGTERFSFPFFFDFSWTAKMVHLPLDHLSPLSAVEEAEVKQRWAKTTFTSVSGEWWQYLAKKVMKVFPELKLPEFEHNVAPSSRFIVAVPIQAKEAES